MPDHRGRGFHGVQRHGNGPVPDEPWNEGQPRHRHA